MGGYFVFYTLTLTPFYPPWKPNAAQIDKRVLKCIFLKNPPIADPLLRHFTPLGSPTLTSFYPLNLTVLAAIPEDCQSRTHNLCTLSCVALTSRPSMLVQLLTVYIYELYLLELLPLNKLPPHSYISLPLRTNYPQTLTPFYPPWQPNLYIILPPLDNLPPHSYTILPLLAAQLLPHFNPLDKLPPHSYMAISVRG